MEIEAYSLGQSEHQFRGVISVRVRSGGIKLLQLSSGHGVLAHLSAW